MPRPRKLELDPPERDLTGRCSDFPRINSSLLFVDGGLPTEQSFDEVAARLAAFNIRCGRRLSQPTIVSRLRRKK
jgi:hypothetical protein